MSVWKLRCCSTSPHPNTNLRDMNTSCDRETSRCLHSEQAYCKNLRPGWATLVVGGVRGWLPVVHLQRHVPHKTSGYLTCGNSAVQSCHHEDCADVVSHVSTCEFGIQRQDPAPALHRKCRGMSTFAGASCFTRTSHANSSESTVCGAAGGEGRRHLHRERAQHDLPDLCRPSGASPSSQACSSHC